MSTLYTRLSRYAHGWRRGRFVLAVLRRVDATTLSIVIEDADWGGSPPGTRN